MRQNPGLITNGMIPPELFPIGSYETIHSLVSKKFANHGLYEHFAGSWNALAYRFGAVSKYGDFFIESIIKDGTAPPPDKRFLQEEVLFNFFSNSFSTFEASFYGLYVIGAFLSPDHFPLSSAKDQQRISPQNTKKAYLEAFPGDSLLLCFDSLFEDSEYQKIREIRNVLTHRTAPGRRMYVGLGTEDAPPTEWKLNDTPINEAIIRSTETELARLVKELLESTENFLNHKISA